MHWPSVAGSWQSLTTVTLFCCSLSRDCKTSPIWGLFIGSFCQHSSITSYISWVHNDGHFNRTSPQNNNNVTSMCVHVSVYACQCVCVCVCMWVHVHVLCMHVCVVCVCMCVSVCVCLCVRDVTLATVIFVPKCQNS